MAVPRSHLGTGVRGTTTTISGVLSSVGSNLYLFYADRALTAVRFEFNSKMTAGDYWYHTATVLTCGRTL